MKKFFNIVFAFAILLNSSISFASERLIEASGSYTMDSRLDETPKSATARAREEAKRAAVEKAGVYIQSYTKVIDLQFDTDEIQMVAARLLKIQNETSNVEIVEKNLLKFTVTITALVDDLNIEDLKDMMQNRQLLEELTRKNKEIQEKYDDLKKEMEKYSLEYDRANENQKAEIKKKVSRNEEDFSAIVAMERGNGFYFVKDYPQALTAYGEAIKLNPTLVEAYNNRGIIKYELEQFSAAIEDYTTAIKLKSDFVDALNNRGNAYVAIGQLQNAAKDLQAALKLKSNSAIIHNNLGSVYISMENFNAAIQEYTQAIRLNPSYSEAYYNRAIAYYRIGNMNQAISDMQTAINLNPNDLEMKNFYKKIAYL